MSEVQESECGVVGPAHIKGVQRTMQEENAFLLLRPTELDSTRLIRAGCATKSMDIHDKSSNWGPMAGFDHMHGEACPVQPFLTDELLATFIKDGEIAQVRPADKLAQSWKGKNRWKEANDPRVQGVRAALRDDRLCRRREVQDDL